MIKRLFFQVAWMAENLLMILQSQTFQVFWQIFSIFLHGFDEVHLAILQIFCQGHTGIKPICIYAVTTALRFSGY